MAKTVADAFHSAEVDHEIKHLLKAQREVVEDADRRLRPWVIHFARFEELYGHPEDPLAVLRRLPYRVAKSSRTMDMPSLFTEEGVGEAILSLCEAPPDEIPWGEFAADDLVFGRGCRLAEKVRHEWKPPTLLSLDAFRGAWDDPDDDPLAHMDVRPVEPLGIPVHQEVAAANIRQRTAGKDLGHGNRTWSKDKIAERFKRFFEEFGHSPSATHAEHKIAPYLPFSSQVYKDFGSWAEACAYAGLRAPMAGTRSRRWEPVEAAYAVAEYAEELGYFPSATGLNNQSRGGRPRTAPTGLAMKRLMGLPVYPSAEAMKAWVARVIAEAESTPPPPDLVPTVDRVITFGEWFEDWSTSEWENEPAKNTRARYIRVVALWALPRFRAEPLCAIDAWKVRRLLVGMREHGEVRRVPEVKSALTSLFAEAIVRGKLATNEAKRVKSPAPLARPNLPTEEVRPVVTRAQVLGALTTKLTGEQLAQRMYESTRDVIPVLVELHQEGEVARVFNPGSPIARFAPLTEATVHQLPEPRSLAAAA